MPKHSNAVLLRPENLNKQYEALFLEIDTGQIKLPMFQREFVWNKEQTAKLIDSILHGFPVGTFIPSYSRRGTDDVRECAYTEEQRVAGVRNWRGFALLEARGGAP